MGKVADEEWQEISCTGRRLLQEGAPVRSPQVQTLALQWNSLVDRLCDHDSTIRSKLVAAHIHEPLLQAAAVLDPEVRDYLRNALTLT